MKKILLVNGFFGRISVFEPLGINIIASVLREKGNQNVNIYDPCIEGDEVEQAVQKVLEFAPEILGISVFWTSSDDVNKFVEKYRSKNKESIIVIGGHGPSLCPERFLSDGVKAVFIGEGEITFQLFVEAIENNTNIYDVPGIAFINDNGKLQTNSLPKRIEDLDQLPLMARDTLPQLINKFGKNIYAQIISSRGCYMNCSYCSVKGFSKLQEGTVYRERSVDSIIKEMKYLYDQYSIRKFNFADDNFMPPNTRRSDEKINDFCNKIIENNLVNIKIHIQCRPDNLRIDMIEKLISVGLIGMFIGIESINREDLDLYGRKADLEESYRIMNELENIGFSCNINSKYRLKIGYITFNSYSTRDTLRNSINFLRKFHITPKKILKRLTPLYKTKIYDDFNAKNLILPDGTARFIDDDINQLYNYLEDIINYILKFRERIRLPIKMHHELGYSSNDILLDNERIKLDNICYNAFEELLDAKVCDFVAIKDKYYNLVSSMQSDETIMKRLRYVEEICGIDENQIKPIRIT